MKIENKRWLYLILGTIALLFGGIIYAWSILKSPFASELGWSNNQLATAFTLTMSCFCFGCLASGFLIRLAGTKITMILGASLVFAGFFFTSTLNGSDILLLYLYYSLFAGGGIGITYNTLLTTVGAWFTDKQGLCSGVLMMGFGASTLIFGNVSSLLISLPAFGWRKVFILLAFFTSGILAIAGLIIRLPKTEHNIPKDEARKNQDLEKVECTDMPPKQMIKRTSFWMFFVAMMLLGSAGSSSISFAKDFSLSVGASESLAGLNVGLLSVANGLGRIQAGVLYDKLGRKFILAYIGVLEIVACIICIIAALSHSIIFCFIGFLAVGLSYGSNTCAVSTLISAFYGRKYFSQNLSIGMMTLIPSSILAKLSTTILTATGGYVVPFILMAVYGVISLCLNLANKKA